MREPSGPLSGSEPVQVAAAHDPVAAVLDAHERGLDIVLDTSGTTSTSRSVVRSTASWWTSFTAYAELTGVDRGARLWLPGPLAATMNLFAAVHASVVGADLVQRPGDATHACLTPAALHRRLGDLAPGAMVTVAGSSLPRTLADRAEASGHATRHYYGAAELSFVAAGRDAESLRPFAGVDIEVRDGVIWVRSPYLGRVPERSPGQQPPRHSTLRRDGDWATVGDLGSLDGTRLLVTGRPDAIQTAGATVVLAEVEQALAGAVPGAIACFGVDRPSVGQVLAVVATDPVDLPALRRAAGVLADSHRPRLWFVARTFPLTAAGKVDRAALADRAATGRLTRA
jgi:long-chain acyl-CoA synthetase